MATITAAAPAEGGNVNLADVVHNSGDAIATTANTSNVVIDGSQTDANLIVAVTTSNAVISTGSGNNLISGTADNSKVVGGGNDTIDLTAHSTTIDLTNSTTSQTSLQGSNNTIIANSGSDTVGAAGNNNVVQTGTGNDQVSVDGNHNIVTGTGHMAIQVTGTGNIAALGNDGGEAFSLAGKNTIHGGAGNDTIHIAGGSALGGDGNDWLDGTSASKALLSGGAGNDTLVGVNDTMTGGMGADTFYFSAGFGKDSITDFDRTGEDVMHFHLDATNHFGGLVINSVNDIVSHATKVNASSVRITLGSDEITIKGISLSDLQAHPDWFIKLVKD